MRAGDQKQKYDLEGPNERDNINTSFGSSFNVGILLRLPGGYIGGHSTSKITDLFLACTTCTCMSIYVVKRQVSRPWYRTNGVSSH